MDGPSSIPAAYSGGVAVLAKRQQVQEGADMVRLINAATVPPNQGRQPLPPGATMSVYA